VDTVKARIDSKGISEEAFCLAFSSACHLPNKCINLDELDELCPARLFKVSTTPEEWARVEAAIVTAEQS
jgi:hypothetical protein